MQQTRAGGALLRAAAAQAVEHEPRRSASRAVAAQHEQRLSQVQAELDAVRRKCDALQRELTELRGESRRLLVALERRRALTLDGPKRRRAD